MSFSVSLPQDQGLRSDVESPSEEELHPQKADYESKKSLAAFFRMPRRKLYDVEVEA